MSKSVRLSARPAADRKREEDGDHQQRRPGQDPGGRAVLRHARLLRSQRRFSSSASTQASSWRQAASAPCRPWTTRSAVSCISWKIRSHSGILGAARTRSSCRAKACEGGSLASAGARQALRAWRQVAGEGVEALHRLGLAQEADQLPGGFLSSRALEDDEARAAGRRYARPVRARQGRSGPVALPLGREPTPELADVPGTGDVEGEQAARELVPHVGHLRRSPSAAPGRRETGRRRSRARAGTAAARRRRGRRHRRAPVPAAATARTADQAR